MRKIMLPIVLLALLSTVASAVEIPTEKALNILKKSDAYHSTLKNSRRRVTLKQYKSGDVIAVKKYIVFTSGDANLVLETEGVNKDNRYLLTKKGVYVKTKRASRPIRIMPLQRLVGESSYGDLATLKFARDYTVVKGRIDGSTATLELQSRSKKTAYRKLTLSVNKNTGEPIKAQAFLVSGKKQKDINYVVKGKRVVEIHYRAPDSKNRKTIMEISKATKHTLPKRRYTKQGMTGRIK